MTDDQTPTQWLAKLHTDPRAEVKLAEYLQSRAREMATRWIGRHTQAGVGPTDVAASAMASLFKDLQTGTLRPADSSSLLCVLACRIHNKAVNALRRRHASMRDIAREEPVTPLALDAGESPVDLAIADELAKRIVELIEAEPDELRRLVTYLGIVEGRTAAEIVAAIEAEVPSGEGHVPSISAIYVWLRAARARIEESLRREGFLDDE